MKRRMALVGTAVTMVAGVVVAAIIALWRRWHIPTQQTEIRVVDMVEPPPPEFLADLDRGDDVQRIDEGTGDFFYRSYQVDIAHPLVPIETLMAHMQINPNAFSPQELAKFEKTKGAADKIQVGDEFFIHIAGPWNGPVRVVNLTRDSFSLATLKDHLEAGFIEFRLMPHPEKQDIIRFEIHSWARSKDMFVNLAYDMLKIAKAAQTSMWIFFCNRVLEMSGGERVGTINVMTQREPQEEAEPTPLWKQYQSHLDWARSAQLNFDPQKRTEFTKAAGWNIDHYEIGLPSESPGEPEERGAFVLAKDILLHYEFPDPNLITGIFVPDEPLAERVMVLRAKFLFLRFWLPARIGIVLDELRQTENGKDLRVWGYSYRTLEGHFEIGEITFEIHKLLETGAVSFHIDAYSKPGHIRNPIYRFGFWIFGRRIQVRFSHTALERMQQMVIERLATHSDETEQETPEVKPLSELE